MHDEADAALGGSVPKRVGEQVADGPPEEHRIAGERGIALASHFHRSFFRQRIVKLPDCLDLRPRFEADLLDGRLRVIGPGDEQQAVNHARQPLQFFQAGRQLSSAGRLLG